MLFRHCEEMSWGEYSDLWRKFGLEAREKFLKDHDRRLDLLFRHYNIDRKTPDAWRELAMALAHAHVPAFQIERAFREYHQGRAKKRIKLDVPGSMSFYLHEYLSETGEKRDLTPFEKNFKEILDTELKGLIAYESRRGLRRQMISAEKDYWHGCANDFQRQFIEQVLPLIIDLFKKLEANRVARTA